MDLEDSGYIRFLGFDEDEDGGDVDHDLVAPPAETLAACEPPEEVGKD